MRRRGVLRSTNWISCSFICFCKCLFGRKPNRHDSDSSLSAIRGSSTSPSLFTRCGSERARETEIRVKRGIPESEKRVCSKANMLSSKVSSVVRNGGARLFSSSLRDISIKGFFAAKNYAIVGASVKPGTMGNIICENYKRTFKGETFYINPKGGFCVFAVIRRWRAVRAADLQDAHGCAQGH